MPQMTTSAARVVDPVLSEVARGYQNAELVGMNLFPFVPVDQRGGKILTFNREQFRLYNTGRSPGANTRRIQLGYASGSYTLEQHALEGQVPMEIQEEAQAGPGIDLGRGAVGTVQDVIALRLEKAQADLATNSANYAAGNKTTLSGTSQWSDLVNSDPTNDIEVAKEAIRSQIGKRPNVVEIGAAVFAKLRLHIKIIDRIKYTGRDVVTTELLASLWGVEKVVIGDAMYEDASGNLVDLWGKFVVVAYSKVGSVADRGRPTFGYTYRLRNYPVVEQPYYDRNSKSWIYPTTDEVAPVIAGAAGGYLISAAVA